MGLSPKLTKRQEERMILEQRRKQQGRSGSGMDNRRIQEYIRQESDWEQEQQRELQSKREQLLLHPLANDTGQGSPRPPSQAAATSSSESSLSADLERKLTPLLAKMRNTLETLTSDTNISKHKSKMQMEEIREEKFGNITPAKQPSSVHFFPKAVDVDSTQVPLSQSFSHEIPFNIYQISSAQTSALTLSSAGRLTSKSTILSLSRGDTSLVKQSTSYITPKKQTLLSFDSDTFLLGDGEDYFLSLFGDSKRLATYSSQTEDVSKHLSVILEEVGQFTSSSLADIKIADVNVKGLFVRLVNSSMDKEVEIGNHILQQNVDGHAVSLYRFPANITMQAGSTVTVWAAASEAKPQPPTDFVWEEQNRFRSSPDCTTILCKPNGEAIAWYTPIHWKQAWEKLETDIEFERSSVVIPTMKSHVFGWTATSTSSISKEKPESIKKESSQCQIEHIYPSLVREKEIWPSTLPNQSPWCRSPYASPHPYCSLIESHDSDISESWMDTKLMAQPAKPESAPETKKKKSKAEENRKQLSM